MRISDWSSDVCSSDLNITIFFHDIFGDLHRRFEIGIGRCHAISVRRVTQINLIPEFHMQSRQHPLGQYNAHAVADLDKFQRLVHTDVITLKGGVEELLSPSANTREPDIRNTSATTKTARLPTESAQPWPEAKSKSLLNLFQPPPP